MSTAEKQIYSEMESTYGTNFQTLSQVETWRQFDEEFTIKAHKHFACAAAYYNAGSCLSHIAGIKVPTLVIHSQDDPIVPVDCVPIDECLANPNIITALTLRGGHVCYF
jgi:predicted alpha/beta-fold hydrolase